MEKESTTHLKLSDLSLKNIKGFIQGNFRKIMEEFDFLPLHIKEQWMYRIGQMNEKCLIDKQCPCQCSVPEKQLEDRACEEGCYKPMMRQEEWEIYKQQVNIDPTLDEAERRIKKYKI